MRRKEAAIVAVSLLYLVLYLATTHVRPQGTGGLGGPPEVRVFQSEPHLVAFYPLYLVERWVRNASFVYATYPFNCDFADRLYVHQWLWGDGKYSTVWYESWEGGWLFLAVGSSVAFLVWKWGRRAPHWAVTCGVLSGFVAVSAMNSILSRKGEEWNGMTVKQRLGGGPVLKLRINSEDGKTTSLAHRVNAGDGGGGGLSGGGADDYWFEDYVVATRNDSFLMSFTYRRPNKPAEKSLIIFPFNQATETNWNGWHIQGKFL